MPSSAATCLVGIGVVGDEVHVERLRQAEHFGADIADAERAERRPTSPTPMMVGALGEAGAALARQPVLDHQLAGQREHQRDDRDGDRPAHAVRRDDSAMPASVQASTSTVS